MRFSRPRGIGRAIDRSAFFSNLNLRTIRDGKSIAFNASSELRFDKIFEFPSSNMVAEKHLVVLRALKKLTDRKK